MTLNHFSMPELLLIEEQKELAHCEAVIERGLETFFEVGQAMATIREKRLYRADYKTFEEYCRDRWGIQLNYANQLITAAKLKVEATLDTINTIKSTRAQNEEAQLAPLQRRLERLEKKMGAVPIPEDQQQRQNDLAQGEMVVPNIQKDLTQSAIDRQNILNNSQAVEKIQSFIGLVGLLYEGEYLFTSKMVANFFQVDLSTIKRILENFENEIKHNGYQVLKGQKLKEFKELFGPLLTSDDDSPQRGVHDPLWKPISDNQSYKRLKSLAVFNFRAFLNVGMLLTQSENAKMLRSSILDIVIDTLNQQTGGSTKFINQRDEEFLVAITREPVYRKEFTNALSQYLDMGNYKYAYYTDAIYKAIFKENAKEYRAILNLEEKDNPRDTMYAEVLKLIASFEVGIADEMKEKAESLGRKLTPSELSALIMGFANKRHWIPQIEDACSKMATRDYGLRNIIHKRLEGYIGVLSKEDYSRFLGDKSKDLIDRLIENPDLLEVFKRLKDR